MDIKKITSYIKQNHCKNLNITIISEILKEYETKSKLEQNIIDKYFIGFTGLSIKTINKLTFELNDIEYKKDKYIEKLNLLVNKLSNEIELLKIVNKDLKDNYWQLKEDLNKTKMRN